MKVILTVSFLESLKVLIKQQSWWYKLYNLFKRKIPNFLINIWNFRKFLWRFKPNSYHEILFGMREGLVLLLRDFNRSKEVEVHKSKKIDKIKRSIDIIDNILYEKYIEISEKKYGKLKSDFFDDIILTKDDIEKNKKIIKYSNRIQKEEWDELFKILKGQDINELIDIENIYLEKDLYDDWFDGSGMMGWWR